MLREIHLYINKIDKAHLGLPENYDFELGLVHTDFCNFCRSSQGLEGLAEQLGADIRVSWPREQTEIPIMNFANDFIAEYFETQSLSEEQRKQFEAEFMKTCLCKGYSLKWVSRPETK